jgi:hypothetical protein
MFETAVNMALIGPALQEGAYRRLQSELLFAVHLEA